jgi:hypothetical protein
MKTGTQTTKWTPEGQIAIWKAQIAEYRQMLSHNDEASGQGDLIWGSICGLQENIDELCAEMQVTQ